MIKTMFLYTVLFETMILNCQNIKEILYMHFAVFLFIYLLLVLLFLGRKSSLET